MEDINKNRPEEVHPLPEGKPVAEHSFDELAKGLADGSVSRRQALRWIGGALVGGLLASIPGAAAFAQQPSTFCGSGYCYPPKVCEKGGGRPRCVCPTVNCPQGATVNQQTCECQCPSGQEMCGGRCVSSCTGGRTLDQSTCTCECPPGTTLCGNGSCVSSNCTGGKPSINTPVCV